MQTCQFLRTKTGKSNRKIGENARFMQNEPKLAALKRGLNSDK